METVRQVIDDDPVPPSRLVPRLARDLETICLKCLNKDPQRRYATAEELADDLDRYREGKPIKARPTPVWERGLKWAKRRPVAAMSVAVGLLAFLGLTAGVIVYQRQAEPEASGTPGSTRSKTAEWSCSTRPTRPAPRTSFRKLRSIWPTFLQDAKDEPRLKPISRPHRDEAEVGGRPASRAQLARGGRATRSRGP